MKRTAAAALLLAAAAVALYAAWATVAARLQWFFGFRSDDGNGSYYLFFSGAGSIFLPPLITLAGLVLLGWWHSQCHVTGCYWPARRVTVANEKACWRHYPHARRTAEDLLRDHHLYLGTRPGKG